jgi:hypothetical protein
MSVGAGLALAWAAIALLALGMFCFDGVPLAAFHDPGALAPDCFVVHVNNWVNPKVWLVTNLAVAATLSLIAHVAGYGFMRGQLWAQSCISVVALLGSAFFAALAVALENLRLFGIGCGVALGVVLLVSLMSRNQQSAP